ncbi:MAG: flagellar hook capping FlgD N-terminal domain-containing protein [Ilumatobacteraceae bacterium]
MTTIPAATPMIPFTTTAPTTATTAPTSTAGSPTLDREAFLKLLVAQLKYQDPSKPMDSSAMISQSAQLSVVDKLESISSILTDSTSTNRLTLGASVIGKQVTYLGTDGATVSALITGVAFEGATTVLKAGTTDIPLASVKSITAATAATAPAA